MNTMLHNVEKYIMNFQWRNCLITNFLGLVAGSFMMTGCSGTAADAEPRDVQSYVIVVEEQTLAKDDWKRVVQALREKHDASLIVYHGEVSEVVPALREYMPRYTCFVQPPENADRQFVVDVQRLTRRLDADPYTDTQWAILTGYEPADALRIAQCTEPLVVDKVFSGTTGIGLDTFTEGYQFDEGKAGEYKYKDPDGDVVIRICPDDSTETITKAWTDDVDAIYTSGHGTTNGWQIGYSYVDGFIVAKDGQLYGQDVQKQLIPFETGNTKVYLPVGNCLVGHIPQRACYATAMMHSGGVNQMFGYTVVTFYGFMGWGVNTYFGKMPGQYSLSDAFYANQQALLYEIGQKYPKLLCAEFDRYDQQTLYQQVMEYYPDDRQQAMGSYWDRDAVAFYGDPAWRAVVRPQPPAWTHQLQDNGDGSWRLDITTHGPGSWPDRPLVFFLPQRLAEATLISGQEYQPEITDNFILVPLKGDFDPQTKISITFSAKFAASKRTSRRDKAVYAGISNADRYKNTIAAMPVKYHEPLKNALDQAGRNAEQIANVLIESQSPQAAAFLIANMPKNDLRTLSSDYLLNHIELAYKVRDKKQWGDIPDDIFLNDVLPYANLDEARDDWRGMLMEKCTPIVAECTSLSQAAQTLNKALWSAVNVKYSTRRARANQSPMESMQSGLASCTGLSILLVDACRSVGIPARIAGIAQWPHKQGNHTWVEVWDGRWYCLGAFDGEDLDQTWLISDAARAQKGSRLNGIYAASYAKTDTPFICAWAPDNTDISAVEVTDRYIAMGTPSENKHITAFRIFEPVNHQRIAARIKILENGTVIHKGISRDESGDTNDTAAFDLIPGKQYTVEITYYGQVQTETYTQNQESFQTADIILKNSHH